MEELERQVEALQERLAVIEQAYNGTLQANQGLREALRNVLRHTNEPLTAEICREALITQ